MSSLTQVGTAALSRPRCLRELRTELLQNYISPYGRAGARPSIFCGGGGGTLLRDRDFIVRLNSRPASTRIYARLEISVPNLRRDKKQVLP
jgi:hypothetical protein